MFVHLSIHYPKPGMEETVIESMHRFGAAIRGKPGNFDSHVLFDKESRRLIGIAAWSSKDLWELSRSAMIEAVKDDDFEAWEERPPDVFHLEEV